MPTNGPSTFQKFPLEFKDSSHQKKVKSTKKKPIKNPLVLARF